MLTNNAMSPEDLVAFSKLSQEEMKEKIIKLNKDLFTLKKFTRQQENKIISLQTKLRKLSMDHKTKNGKLSTDSISLFKKKHEEELEELRAIISRLQNKNKNLSGSLQVANLQLKSVKQSRVPSYLHVTSRVDSGLRNIRKSRSLLSIPQSSDLLSRPPSGAKRISSSRTGKARSLSPSESSDSAEEKQEVRLILHEARNRILELEEAKNNLQFQFEELQKATDEEKSDLRAKLFSIEKSFEKREADAIESQDDVKRKEESLIRLKAQVRSVTARMEALSDCVTQLEKKVEEEKLLKEEAQERRSLAERRVKEKERSLEDALERNEKLEDVALSVSNWNESLKKEVQILKSENERITTICVHKNSSTGRTEEPKKFDNEGKRRLGNMEEKPKSRGLYREKEGRTTKSTTDNATSIANTQAESINALEKELKLLRSQLNTEKAESSVLKTELFKEKEKSLKAESEVQILKASNQQLSIDLKNVVFEKERHQPHPSPLPGRPEVSQELVSQFENWKEMKKTCAREKLNFEDLRTQFMELQLLYREKATQLERLSSSGQNLDSSTYKERIKEIEIKNEELKKENEEQRLQIMKLKNCLGTRNGVEEAERPQESTLKNQESTLKNQDSSKHVDEEGPGKNPLSGVQELDEVHSPHKSKDIPESKNNKGNEPPPEEVLEALYLKRHYNAFKIFLKKLVFELPVESSLKTFLSWVVPMPLQDPLQHSNLAFGSPAAYKFASLYKFKMNRQNFDIIKNKPLDVNVFALASDNHPHKIGECKISLKPLMERPDDEVSDVVDVKHFEDCDCDASLLPNVNEAESAMKRRFVGSLHFSVSFCKSGTQEYISRFETSLAKLSPRNGKLDEGAVADQEKKDEGKSTSKLSGPEADVTPCSK